jgi:hypothetical protein
MIEQTESHFIMYEDRVVCSNSAEELFIHLYIDYRGNTKCVVS